MSDMAGGCSLCETGLNGLHCVRQGWRVFSVSYIAVGSSLCQTGMGGLLCVKHSRRVFTVSDMAGV